MRVGSHQLKMKYRTRLMMTIPPYNLEMEHWKGWQAKKRWDYPIASGIPPKSTSGMFKPGISAWRMFCIGNHCFKKKGAKVTLFQEKVSLPWAPWCHTQMLTCWQSKMIWSTGQKLPASLLDISLVKIRGFLCFKPTLYFLFDWIVFLSRLFLIGWIVFLSRLSLSLFCAQEKILTAKQGCPQLCSGQRLWVKWI